MKNSLYTAILSGLVVMACHSKAPTSNPPAEIAVIQHVMDEQQIAWNRGDIDGFMNGYWASDSLRFIGKRGITYGWQATLDNYKKSYPGAAAMGRLQFTNLSMELTGDSSAYVIGKWELFRTTDTLGGHYSLLWRKQAGRWMIVADHSS
jgi:ketosteroid isomerase-like protein